MPDEAKPPSNAMDDKGATGSEEEDLHGQAEEVTHPKKPEDGVPTPGGG